jgi:citrate synthase
MHDPMLRLTNPFWREEPFTEPERALLDALFLAHHRSAFRDNPSSVTVINAAAGSGDLAKAIAAAILTTGGKHAPLTSTVEFLSLEDPAAFVPKMLEAGLKVPGWGGTFQKDEPDPIWAETARLLAANWPLLAAKLGFVSVTLRTHGKVLCPNPSAYTAASCIIIGLPAPLAPYLFTAARLSAWTQIAARGI